MTTPLHVDPSVLHDTATGMQDVAAGVRGTSPGEALAGIGGSMPGLATGAASQQVGDRLNDQAASLGERYARYSEELGSSAAAYERGDAGAANKIEGVEPDAPAPENGGPTAPPPGPNDYHPITAEQLQKIVPEMSAQRAQEIVGPLNETMRQGGMNTPRRQAAFISQVAVESDRFRTFEEYADGSEYEGRTDIGNTHPGDGVKYKGRGAIQVTGRGNYEKMSKDLGVDFVNHPELAAQPQYAFKSALWYWNTHNGNAVADTGDIAAVTTMVNGGDHALDVRTTYYNRGLQVLAQ